MNQEQVKEIALRFKDEILMPYDSIIDLVGYEALCAIADSFHGTSIYIPDKRRIFGKCLEKQIILDFDGSYQNTARRFGYSERQVRDIMYRWRQERK